MTAGLLIGWGLLHLIGSAMISVLPLSILPFDLEQSLQHYIFHVVYGLTQLPLIGLLLVYFWQTRPTSV